MVDPPAAYQFLSILWLAIVWVSTSMAKRARIQLNELLQQLSDDEWAVEGSDDDLGMDEDYSYDAASSDESIIAINITRSNFYYLLYIFITFIPLASLSTFERAATIAILHARA